MSAKIGMRFPGVDRLMYSGAAASYRTFYTDQTAEQVVQRYACDIGLFGYRFDGNKPPP